MHFRKAAMAAIQRTNKSAGRSKTRRQTVVCCTIQPREEGGLESVGAVMRERRVQMQDKSQRATDLGSNWRVRELEPMRLTSGVLLGD